MAKTKECERYGDCGFVQFRIDTEEKFSAGDDCGIEIQKCARLNPYVPKVEATYYGPKTQGEVKVVKPILYTDEGGREHRVP